MAKPSRSKPRTDVEESPAPPDVSMRVLPYDLEAEKALLGAVLINAGALVRAQQKVRADDFFRRAHQEIFAAMVRLTDKRKSEIDLVTVKAELQRADALDECGGVAYLASLVDGVPRSANVQHYASIVKEHAIRRTLIKSAGQLLEGAYDRTVSVDELITDADRTMIELQHGAASDRLVDLRATAPQLLDDLEQRRLHRGEVNGIETGFASINEMTFGWQRGDLVVLAARPSIGKTAFVLNSAIAAAKLGHRVLIESLEMRRRQLEYRLLSHLSGVPLTQLLSGWLGETDYEKLVPAMQLLNELPIYVDDRGRQTVWDIRASARRLRSEGGLDLVVVDYIQLISGSLDRRGTTRNEEITDISRRLKELADEVSCPVIALSQLSRAGDTRSDKRPILSDLRDSGALEQDADLVCFLHRKHHRESGLTYFILEKQRNGPTGAVNLTITRETQTFTDGGVEPEQPELPEAPAKVEEPKPPRHWRRGR